MKIFENDRQHHNIIAAREQLIMYVRDTTHVHIVIYYSYTRIAAHEICFFERNGGYRIIYSI